MWTEKNNACKWRKKNGYQIGNFQIQWFSTEREHFRIYFQFIYWLSSCFAEMKIVKTFCFWCLVDWFSKTSILNNVIELLCAFLQHYRCFNQIQSNTHTHIFRNWWLVFFYRIFPQSPSSSVRFYMWFDITDNIS